ncbi:MAG TPA: hypothetical protein PKJ03_09400, partial [Methanoregulaceae archaeon]|nr:hypothetical protein [Methanoregulaceae archaeon]
MSEKKKLSAAERPNLDHDGNPKGFFALSLEVLVELKQAMTKHPTWPTDPLHALAILGEEFGELTKAMLQLTYEPAKTSHQEVYAEAIQTTAMALRL